MKGVILAGGNGSRLYPLTKVTNKQLLPVYNKPLIYYPLNVLIKAEIKEVLIITSNKHLDDFKILLGDGENFGISIQYKIQNSPLGLAHGLSLAENFANGDEVTMILGDNIFEDNVSQEIKDFNSEGAKIFFVKVPDPNRFGCPVFNEDNSIKEIIEKPETAPSEYAQSGLFIYDKSCFKKIKTLNPSKRNEIEITDLNNIYLKQNLLDYKLLSGKWFDTGTFESLLDANNWCKDFLENNPNYFVFKD